MSPNLLFHPVFDQRETSPGMPYRKVVHPPAKNWVDPLDHPPHRLARMSPENVPEPRQRRRSLLQLWRVLRPPHPFQTSDAAKVEPQESETLLLPEVHHSAFLLVYLYLELCEFFPHSFLQRRYDPAMPRMGIHQHHQRSAEVLRARGGVGVGTAGHVWQSRIYKDACSLAQAKGLPSLIYHEPVLEVRFMRRSAGRTSNLTIRDEKDDEMTH
jgi:hypothetical protein